jgi:hypothetical protein
MSAVSKSARVPLTKKVEVKGPRPDFADLLGKTLTSITISEDKDRIDLKCGDEWFVLHHIQDCCEFVSIEDICGDLDDLIGHPLLLAEEASSRDNADDKTTYAYGWAGAMGVPVSESSEWTFYKLATIKGCVTIRWYGDSEYYSTDVTFERVN